MSLQSFDHFGTSTDFFKNIEELLKKFHLKATKKMRFITLPRVLNFVFNPISVLVLFDEQNLPTHILAEVHNYNNGRIVYPVKLEKKAKTDKKIAIELDLLNKVKDILNQGNFANAFIVGSGLCATAANYTFVNNLCNVSGGTSDCRLKENINPIPYGLSELTKLEPVSYNFKSDESKAIKYGFLAQCIQEVMPDLIKYHPTDLVDGDKVLQFEKEAVWASMVNAIKELKNRVELLESK
jgi:hypothetical protein